MRSTNKKKQDALEEEIQLLLKKRSQDATKSINTLIDRDVPQAIDNINRICEESILKIEEKTSQIVAKITSRINSVKSEIQTEVEEIKDYVTGLENDQPDTPSKKEISAMISESSRQSIGRIEGLAKGTVSRIRDEVDRVLDELGKSAAEAINGLRAMTQRTANKIKDMVKRAGDKLQNAKQEAGRSEHLNEVKEETRKVVTLAESASMEFEAAKARTVERLNASTEAAIRRIEEAYADAAEDIGRAKEKALGTVKAITDAALQSFSQS